MDRSNRGSQMDAMKRVRKEMPPPTKVIKPTNKRASSRNWRDLIEDDEDSSDYEWEGR